MKVTLYIYTLQCCPLVLSVIEDGACVFSFSLQEFIAYGIMNVIGSFFSSFNAAGSLSRSTIQANSGGRTQVGYTCVGCLCVGVHLYRCALV